MTSNKNLITASLATFLLVSGVQGQTDLTLLACDPAATGAERGSKLTTYEILCGKKTDDTAIGEAVALTGATFGTLCTLLDSGPWVTSDSEVIDLLSYFSETPVNEHTFIAPTDAAFANIQSLVDSVLATEDTDILAFNNIVSSWLQLHILPDTYLLKDFECDETIDTLNLGSSRIADQRQLTRCRGDAFTFEQIGAGNVGDTSQPTIGSPSGVFTLGNFAANGYTKVTTDLTSASSNIIGCNGVIHVVDEVLQPGSNGFFYGSKGGKGFGKSGRGKSGRRSRYYGGYGPPRGPLVPRYFPNRELEGVEDEVAGEVDRAANLEDRRALLESLLIDAEGNTEKLD